MNVVKKKTLLFSSNGARDTSQANCYCIAFHKKFALFCGRGAPTDVAIPMKRTDALLALIGRKLGSASEVAQILFQTS